MGETKQCCCQRTKERTPEEYKILVQSAAVTAAMNAFNRELLSDHIRTCVVDDIREGNDETIDELLKTLQKLMR